jgi:hypothetical protein
MTAIADSPAGVERATIVSLAGIVRQKSPHIVLRQGTS